MRTVNEALPHPDDYAVGTPWFDYAFRAFNPERRLEHLLEWQWEEFSKYGRATAGTHVFENSFEFDLGGAQ